ncbi:MAG: stage 0 sporulation family protein [Dehalococcoidia bacterium]
MPEVVSIVFRDAGPSYYFAPGDVECEVGDWVVVETSHGLAMGKVIASFLSVADKDIEGSLKAVKRKAGESDLSRREELKAQEAEVLTRCAELVSKHDLPMKLVNAEYNFDGSHLTVFFTSEGKVDFRALLKEMGTTFKTRVELRQVGARDAAKLIGGIGRCGRVLCCASFLDKFVPISVRMARDQSLPLNPASISGPCGKLLCCLKYEHDQYLEMKNRYPALGSRVNIPQGEGKIIYINHFKGTVMVQLESETTVELKIEDVSPVVKKKGGGNAGP